MSSKNDKSAGYTAAVVICTIILGAILGTVSTFAGIGMGRGLAGMTLSHDPDVEREQGAATVANILGGALGTDDKGKAGLSAALSNLAKAGEQAEQQERAMRAAANATGGGSAAGDTQSAAAAATDASGSSSGDPAQNPAAAVGGLLTALGGAMGGQTRHQPVPFQTLKEYLPDSLPGLTRTNAEGSAKQAMGVQGTSANGTYEGANGARVQIHIADMTGVSGLMDLAGNFVTDESSESSTGFEKTVNVGGRLIHQKWDGASKYGETSVILAKRFSVEVTGNNVDMATLEQSLAQVNLTGLEAMRDAGAIKQ